MCFFMDNIILSLKIVFFLQGLSTYLNILETLKLISEYQSVTCIQAHNVQGLLKHLSLWPN